MSFREEVVMKFIPRVAKQKALTVIIPPRTQTRHSSLRMTQLRSTLSSILLLLYVLLGVIYVARLTSASSSSSQSGCYGLAQSHQDILYCKPTTLSGLTFCSEMNGKITDEGFNTKKLIVTVDETSVPTSYAEMMDRLLEQIFSDLRNYMVEVQAKRGGQVCDSCISKLKALMCANSFPASGLHSCITNNVMGKLKQIDKKCGTSLCGCPQFGLCSIDNNGNFCTLNDPPTDWRKLLCLFTKLPDIPVEVKKCNRYFTPLNQCIETMASCGCIDDDRVKSMCSKIFLPNGLLEIALPEGDCTSTSNWCQTTSSSTYSTDSTSSQSDDSIYSRILQHIEPYMDQRRKHLTSFLQLLDDTTPQTNPTIKEQLVCPNEELCIAIPAPLITPSLVGLSKLTASTTQYDTSAIQRISQNMACSGSDDPDCPRGCTRNEALAYDPSMRIDDGSCDKDPLVLMSWGKRNLPWMITVFVLVVTFILLVIIVGVISCVCCCCKSALCCCCCAPAKAIL